MPNDVYIYYHFFRVEEALENNEDGEIMEMEGGQMEDEVDSNGAGWPINTMSDPGAILSTPPMQSGNVFNRTRSLSQNEGIKCYMYNVFTCIMCLPIDLFVLCDR